jgi:hypothetical protein
MEILNTKNNQRLGKRISAKMCCITKTTLGTPPKTIPPKRKEIDRRIIFNLLSSFCLRNKIPASKPTEIRIINDNTTNTKIPI